MDLPAVTILMAVRNGMPFLKYAVESILSQSYKNYNFIIVNNGSTDNSQKYLESLKDERIVICNVPSVCIAEALNHGLEKIKTGYVAIMDSDDISYPERISEETKFLNHHPDYVLVGTSIKYIGTENSGRTFSVKMPCSHEKIIRGLTTQKFVIAHSTVMIRTEALKEIGGYNNSCEYTPDVDLYLRLKSKGKFTNLNSIYSYVRLDKNSFTGRNLFTILKSQSLKAKKRSNKIGILLKKMSLWMDYFSQLIYKNALIKYLNGNSQLWLLMLTIAAFIYLPKAFFFAKEKIKY